MSKKRSRRKAGRKQEFAAQTLFGNVSVDIVSTDCVGSEGASELRACVTVQRGTNEEIEYVSVWGEDSGGIPYILDVTEISAVPNGGGWLHTYKASGEVDCDETYTVKAEVGYIVYPPPASATPVEHVDCPECEEPE